MDEAEFWRLGLENFANFVAPLASVGTGFIAWWGIWSWKRNRVWDREREFAEDALLNARKHLLKISEKRRTVSLFAMNRGLGEEMAFGELRRFIENATEDLDSQLVLLELSFDNLSVVCNEDLKEWVAPLCADTQTIKLGLTALMLAFDPEMKTGISRALGWKTLKEYGFIQVSLADNTDWEEGPLQELIEERFTILTSQLRSKLK